MSRSLRANGSIPFRLSLISAVVGSALIVAYPAGYAKDSRTPMTVRGVVAGSLFTPPAGSTPSSTKASYYLGARVCVDANNNGICDAGEASTTTDKWGEFFLESPVSGPLVAEILTTSTNAIVDMPKHEHGWKDDRRDDRHDEDRHADRDDKKHAPAAARVMVLRASLDQIAEGARDDHHRDGHRLSGEVAITPLSTEVVRMMEADNLHYLTAKQDLASRLDVPVHDVLRDPNRVRDDSVQAALLTESVILTNRFTLATKMFNRGDVSPTALAANPNATGPAISMPEAEQAAMNVEGIPRYDHIFIVMLENKGTSSIRNSPFAPKINGYLNSGNQFTNYFATGNPSEPNYTALGGADDFGISDDSQWNCDATGPNAPQDLPLPDKTQPGLASSPFAATCTQASAINHNIVGRPNLFNALSAAGMTWRTYNESMNPGQDIRTDSVADSAVVAADHVYPPGTVGPNTTTIGNPNLLLPLPAGLYKTKHHPGMAYQNVRSAPEFRSSNRTMGGGQWDAALLSTTAYAIPAGYDIDQFDTDLQTGDIGNLNFVIPDQCDDMHGITVRGTVPGSTTPVTASDCASVSNNVAITTSAPIITRGDNYVDFLVRKIQASPIWRNPHKRVAIVLMFDEGGATSGFNSCCGWNPANSAVANPLTQNPDGTFSKDTSINNYTRGNRGHGNSIFGVLTNQPSAPRGISDNDAYSHFSFVRTLQDMFQLADPAADGSYMNRSKYTEKFIAANILNLPEYAGSADTHFDSVRPMNHAFVAPSGYVQKQSTDRNTPAQVGPDANQINVWALK